MANVLSRTAAMAAYRHGREWLDELLVTLQANRDYLYETVQNKLPGVNNMARPEATYLAWLDCRGAGLPGNPGEFFLDKARFALSDGAEFGQGRGLRPPEFRLPAIYARRGAGTHP